MNILYADAKQRPPPALRKVMQVCQTMFLMPPSGGLNVCVWWGRDFRWHVFITVLNRWFCTVLLMYTFVDLWLDFLLLLNTQGLADLSGSQHFPPLFDIYSSSNFKYYLWCAIFTVLPLPLSLPKNPTMVTSPCPHPIFRLCVCVRKYHEVKKTLTLAPDCVALCVLMLLLQCNDKDGCSNS